MPKQFSKQAFNLIMVGKNKLATTSASRLSVAAVPLGLLIRLSPFLLCTFLLSACNQNTVEPKVASTNSSSQSSDSASGTANTSSATTSASSNSSTCKHSASTGICSWWTSFRRSGVL